MNRRMQQSTTWYIIYALQQSILNRTRQHSKSSNSINHEMWLILLLVLYMKCYSRPTSSLSRIISQPITTAGGRTVFFASVCWKQCCPRKVRPTSEVSTNAGANPTGTVAEMLGTGIPPRKRGNMSYRDLPPIMAIAKQRDARPGGMRSLACGMLPGYALPARLKVAIILGCRKGGRLSGGIWINGGLN